MNQKKLTGETGNQENNSNTDNAMHHLHDLCALERVKLKRFTYLFKVRIMSFLRAS